MSTSFKEHPDCTCGHPEPYHHIQTSGKVADPPIPDGQCRVAGCRPRCKLFVEVEAKK